MKQLSILFILLLGSSILLAQEIIVSVQQIEEIKIDITNISMKIKLMHTVYTDQLDEPVFPTIGGRPAKSVEDVIGFLKKNNIDYKLSDKVNEIPGREGYRSILSTHSFIELPKVNREEIKKLDDYNQLPSNLEYSYFFITPSNKTTEIEDALHRKVVDTGRLKAAKMARALGKKLGELLEIEIIHSGDNSTMPGLYGQTQVSYQSILSNEKKHAQVITLFAKMTFSSI